MQIVEFKSYKCIHVSFQGQHITNVVNEEITVMVGRDQCVVQAIADTLIICIAPQRDEPVSENVIVSE